MKRNALILTILLPLISGAQTALEISQKASEAMNLNTMEMSSTLKILDDKGRERIRETVTATGKFNGVSKTIVRFTAPPDVKGTALLIHDYENKADDMWIYLPALRKERRIVSNEKGKSFMGSEFSNADMSKPNLNDFEYRILSSENLENTICWKIESIGKTEAIKEENGYSKRIAWIAKENYLVHKMEFYDLNGTLKHIQTIKDYRKQPDGTYFAHYMEKENLLNGRKSIMIINKFQSGSSLPENTFSPALLSK